MSLSRSLDSAWDEVSFAESDQYMGLDKPFIFNPDRV